MSNIQQDKMQKCQILRWAKQEGGQNVEMSNRKVDWQNRDLMTKLRPLERLLPVAKEEGDTCWGKGRLFL